MTTNALACSRQWDDAGLPAVGTASHARFWVALEAPGSWPAKAVAELAPALEKACSVAGGRALLIRRPGRHVADTDQPRDVLLAGGLTTPTPWLVTARIEADHLGLLEALPWDSLFDDSASGIRKHLQDNGITVVDDAPDVALLICTNGKRDVCCALRARPVVNDVAREHPREVWECTHTGGHRFAPTGILLPFGMTYARLTADLASSALVAARDGRMPVELCSELHDRGRSALTAPEQVAEASVRAALDEQSLTALTCEASADNRGQVVVTHTDGRRWAADVSHVAGPDLPASCGKPGEPATVWSAALTELPSL